MQREVCAETTTPVVAQTFDNSSTHITYVNGSHPCPPYSFGTGIPMNPYFAIFLTVSAGNCSVSSVSCARGFTSFSANSLNRERTISCFLSKVKSMISNPPCFAKQNASYACIACAHAGAMPSKLCRI